MTRYDARIRAFAAALSLVAGYVDAVAFVALGGFFVSFMSGNSTRLGVGMSSVAADAILAAGLIATFVLGVAAGTLTGHAAGSKRSTAVLGLVSSLLLGAAMVATLDMKSSAIAAMTLAMGAMNAVFTQNGEVRIGLTYMTGSLVRVGQGLAAALLGHGSWTWLPYALLWAGLVIGAATGTLAYLSLGLEAIWGAAVASILLTMLSVPLFRMASAAGEKNPR